jgi:hypothetical protein
MIFLNEAVAGVFLLILTLLLQCAGVAALIEWLEYGLTRETRFGPLHSAVLVVRVSVAIILLHSLVILVWASWFRLRCFRSWELAFYFSASSYVTVGYGDVILPSNWRLLGPLEGMTGVLMCGVSVALLFALINRLIDRDTHRRRESMVLKTPDLRSTNYIKSSAAHSRENSHG